MVKIWGGKEDMSNWKPVGLEDHLTIGELAKAVNRTTRRIKQAEKLGYLPIPIRGSFGAIRIRLYSPTQVSAIKRHFANTKPGGRKQ